MPTPPYLSTDPAAGQSTPPRRYLSTDPHAGRPAASLRDDDESDGLLDTAIAALPAVGGFAGSLVGAGKWNPLGMAGAAAGGAGGEFVRQIVQAARGKDVPTSLGGQVTAAAEQAALQAGLEGGGRAVLGAGARMVKGLRRVTISPAVKDLAIDTALDLVPGGRTMRTAARTATRALRGAAEEPAAVRGAAPRVESLVEHYDRYMPNVSASAVESAAARPLPARAMNGPHVRALSEGEERGIQELDALFKAKYGPAYESMPSQGNGLYREPAELLDALQTQQRVSDPRRLLAASHAPPPPARAELVDDDLERGRELGRLLEKLASGRGGR